MAAHPEYEGEKFAAGLEVRRAVLGADYVDASLANADEKYFKRQQPFWNLNIDHTTYDEVWRSRAVWRHLKAIRPAVMLVGGWWTDWLTRRYGARLGRCLPLALTRFVTAGAFLAFMASFDNVPVSLFLADERTEVLPIHLWQQIDTNLDVRTASASGVIIIITLALMVLAEKFAGLTRQMR